MTGIMDCCLLRMLIIIPYKIFLNKIMTDLQFLSQNMSATSDVNSIIANVPSGTVRMAMAFIGALPVIIVFPFFQKYFTKGITAGAVKE